MASRSDHAPVLVTGSSGMLGTAVIRAAAGTPTIALPRTECDLADADAVARSAPIGQALGGVIHCAGWTDVDGAESHPDEAHAGNVDATRNVAVSCARLEVPLLVVSTDYVFNGRSDRPYVEDDEPDPQSVYGTTKLEAERVARECHPSGTRVVRTSWLYGSGGRSFPDTILRLVDGGRTVRVVNDQHGSPTWTDALAPLLWELLRNAPVGIYHATGSGICSWFEFARTIVGLAGLPMGLVTACNSTEYPQPAARPAWSALDCSLVERTLGRLLPLWEDSLANYLRGNQSR